MKKSLKTTIIEQKRKHVRAKILHGKSLHTFTIIASNFVPEQLNNGLVLFQGSKPVARLTTSLRT